VATIVDDPRIRLDIGVTDDARVMMREYYDQLSNKDKNIMTVEYNKVFIAHEDKIKAWIIEKRDLVRTYNSKEAEWNGDQK
jgi:hypothetical protein